MYIFCQILCFILKNDMLTFSSSISCIISYNIFLNNIYIISHLHVSFTHDDALLTP
jgi:predicted membrane chloride channel (bestrophin family)